MPRCVNCDDYKSGVIIAMGFCNNESSPNYKEEVHITQSCELNKEELDD